MDRNRHANGPDTWDDVLAGGRKLRAKGHPVGIGLAHHNDVRNSWRAIMWCYGGSAVAKDGKTVTWDSREVRDALEYMRTLYREAMTPEVLSWDDASNNRFLASGGGSWIHNPISAYRTIQKENKELADKVYIELSPRGPVTRLSFANSSPTRSRSSPRIRPRPGPSSSTLRTASRRPSRASTGYNNPFLGDFARGPLPIISEDPKLKPLEKSAEYSVTIGYPGPVTPASDEVDEQFALIDAVAQYCTDKMDLEQTVKWADGKIKGIYAKFA